MKSCSSIRYGGLIVDATDCDYTSFKHLGLVCPICHRSVFLVSGAERKPHERKLKDGSKTQVKESKVDAYFAHHPEVDKAIVNDCELRSSQITKVQREAIAAKARNQRRKILQAHFWKIAKTTPDFDLKEQFVEGFKFTFINVCSYSEMRAKKEYQLLIDYCVNAFNRYAHHELDIAIRRLWVPPHYMRAGAWKPRNEWLYTLDSVEKLMKYWAGIRSAIDGEIQKEIVKEAVLFLTTKMQYPLLFKLCEAHIADYVWTQIRFEIDVIDEVKNDYLSIEEAYPKVVKSMIGMDSGELDIVASSVFETVVEHLLIVNWADQFERLQNEEVKRNALSA